MRKFFKKKWLLPAAALVTAGAVGAGVFLGTQSSGETVGVYPFDYLGLTEYWGDSQESYGPVSTDNIQTVFLTESQTVTEVLVKEGDTVKKGDQLLSFDTTLDDLALERKRLAVEKGKLQLENAQSELIRLNSLKPMQIPTEQPEVIPDYGDTLLVNYQISKNTVFDGSSPEKSLICWLKDVSAINDTLLNNLWQKAMEYQSLNVQNPSSSASAVPETTAATVPATVPTVSLILIESAHVTIDGVTFAYTGSPIQPQAAVSINGQVLTENTHYTVEYENNVNPGNAAVIVRGMESAGYTGEVRISFAIYAPTPEPTPEPSTEASSEPTTSPTVSLIPIENSHVAIGGVTFAYTGSPIQPQVAVCVDGQVLSENVHYTVEYGNNVAPGNAAVIVRGIESAGYTGEVHIGFAIYSPTVSTPEPTPEPSTEASSEPTTATEPSSEPTGPVTPISDFYVIFKITQGNQEKAPVTYWQGLHVFRMDDGGFSFQFFQAESIEDHTVTLEEPPSITIDYGSGYTAKELAHLRQEARENLEKLEFDLKMAEAEYKIMQREVSDGYVYAEVDGEVVSLLDPEEAKSSNQPVVKVSGGGGFYIEGSVSELEKERLLPGQTVTVNDWNTGMTYDGEVVSIGDFPTTDNGWNGMGNPNASYYPFQVFVDGSADLQAGRYASITYSTSEGGNGLYLENAFLRTEQGESFVYVLGENNRLEKRTVTVGKSLWGSYTQILSGLSEEDLLAFPYGKDVKEGAPAEEKDISELYSY